MIYITKKNVYVPYRSSILRFVEGTEIPKKSNERESGGGNDLERD